MTFSCGRRLVSLLPHDALLYVAAAAGAVSSVACYALMDRPYFDLIPQNFFVDGKASGDSAKNLYHAVFIVSAAETEVNLLLSHQSFNCNSLVGDVHGGRSTVNSLARDLAAPIILANFDGLLQPSANAQESNGAARKSSIVRATTFSCNMFDRSGGVFSTEAEGSIQIEAYDSAAESVSGTLRGVFGEPRKRGTFPLVATFQAPVCRFNDVRDLFAQLPYCRTGEPNSASARLF